MKTVDLLIIGGGSAGLAAALSATDHGVHDILILEREKELGGILQQCIHNGFGIQLFKEELSGPSFAERLIDLVDDKKIAFKLNTMVIHMNSDKEIEYVNPVEGYQQIKARAIILAMGCRERTRGAIATPGYRPAGVWSAGTAQRYLNLEGYMVGKKVFILGSGDIGLIMARRLSLEGAQVMGVAELMPYSNGLARNIKQCLEDYDIPLYLSHTITEIHGPDRVSGVSIAQVDDQFHPIESSTKFIDVDTVLFSIGLIPENALSEEAKLRMDPITKGPIVDESFQTSISGIFACGNVLHVHDLVDYVAREGMKAGISAASFLRNVQPKGPSFVTKADQGLRYILPHSVNVAQVPETIEFMFRVNQPYRNVDLVIKKDGEIFKRIHRKHMVPSEMEKFILSSSELKNIEKILSVEIVEITS